jgi:hypothetical protein
MPPQSDPLALHPAPWRRAAALYRVRLRPRWREIRPLILIGLFLCVLVLGTIGFYDWSREPFDAAGNHRPDYSIFDAFYRSLLLFGLGGAVDPPVPTNLQIARIVAPLLTGLAAVQGLLALSREQLKLAGLRILLRDHVVVAGLGDAGFRLATALHASGLRVVALERDPSNPALAGCRERGISVLKGDATDARLLARAGVPRARHLIVTCGDDGDNVDVTVAARDITPARRSGTLTVLVHVKDLGFWRALQAQTLAGARGAPYRLELFNLFDAAARLALQEHPPRWDGDGPVLIVGLEGMGENLLLNLAGLWVRRRPTREDRLAVTIAGPGCGRQRDQLVARYPELDDACQIDVLDMDLDSADLPDQAPVREAAAAYVSLIAEADALAAGLTVAAGARADAPIVVGVADEDAGVARALRGSGPDNVSAFGVLSRTLRPALLLLGTNEALARAKHEQYVRDQRAKGDTPETSDALVDWEELHENFKEQNRRFAEGIGEKLRAAGCGIVPAPLIDTRGPLLRFGDEEVEELAKLEHDRWADDLERDGWRFTEGPKDTERKLHPLLIPWDALDEEQREKDREPMRALPEMLAGVGFELYRMNRAEARAVERAAM